jgi:hypothetical protein
MPFAQDRRRGDEDGAEIHAVEEQGDEAQGEDEDVKASQLQPVEQRRDVDVLCGHPTSLRPRCGAFSLESKDAGARISVNRKMSTVIFFATG